MDFIMIGLPLLGGVVASVLFLFWCYRSSRLNFFFGFLGWLFFIFGCFLGGIYPRSRYREFYAAIGDNPGQIADIAAAIIVGFGLYSFIFYSFRKMKFEGKLKGATYWIVTVVAFVYVFFALAVFRGPGASRDNSTQIRAKSHLRSLIRKEDEFFQRNGRYLAFQTDGEDKGQQARSDLGWRESYYGNCTFSVVAEGKKFTASVKCPLSNGEFNYMGYVRTEPGTHIGLDDAFGKCRKEGIYTAHRSLVNTLGPCGDQNGSVISVVSGSLKRLVVKTLPQDAEVRVDGKLIGATTDRDRFISSDYGAFFWENPKLEKMTVTISKPGYEAISFPLDWGSYTYEAVVVLRPTR